MEGLDCIGIRHDRTGLCLGMAQQLDRAAHALVDRIAIDVNTAHACRKAYMLVAGDNRGVDGIGYMTQATRKVIGGDIGHDGHELVAAKAHKLVSRTNAAANGCRHSAEREIASMTATGIVEDPKIIKVNHRNAGVHTGAAKLFLVIAAIMHARQHIGVDKVLFCGLLFIDRAHHQQNVRLALDRQRAHTGTVLNAVVEQPLRYLIGACHGLKT